MRVRCCSAGKAKIEPLEYQYNTPMPSSFISKHHRLMKLSTAAILALTIIICVTQNNVASYAPPSPSNPSSNRRHMLQKIISASSAASSAFIILSNHEPAVAVAPFAPVDALLPATRVRIMLDKAVNVASKLVDTGNDIGTQQQMLKELESLLLTNQNFNRGTTPIEMPQQPAKSYLDAYADYRKSVSILEKPGAMLVQNGEIDAWKRLKRQEKLREETDEIRAALNYYTSNINFNAGELMLIRHLVDAFFRTCTFLMLMV